MCVRAEELVGLVQRLTASEEEHSKSVAELTQQVEQLQEEQELVVRIPYQSLRVSCSLPIRDPISSQFTNYSS